ncbi:MAG: GIY-YIG nuclease family protein [Candidatus Sericytochromatia bacterium]|nr:GIY-YIG nuclease family protein [Candidatus Sericytochromatia bacterium]
MASLADLPLPDARGHYVYVLRCGDGSLYTGYSTDVARRLATHAAGKGARYTRSRLPVALCAWWPHATREEALRAEWTFKRLPRREKLRRLPSASQARPGGAAGAGPQRPRSAHDEGGP